MRIICTSVAASLMLSFSVLASESPLPPTEEVEPSTSTPSTPRGSFVTLPKKRKNLADKKHGYKNVSFYNYSILHKFAEKHPKDFEMHEEVRLSNQKAKQRSASSPDLSKPKRKLDTNALMTPAKKMMVKILKSGTFLDTLKEACQIINKYHTYKPMLEDMTDEEYMICLSAAYFVDVKNMLNIPGLNLAESTKKMPDIYENSTKRFFYLKELRTRILLNMPKKVPTK